MHQDVFTFFHCKSNWFHQSLTTFSTISWVYIYMLTPEAFRTVIGVAIPFYKHTAIPAGKIFNVPLESLVHYYSLKRLSRSKVRFKLGDTVAARSKSQCSRTNSLNISLYSAPTGKCAFGLGTNASFTFFL